MVAGSKAPSIDRPTLDYFEFRGPHRVAGGRLETAGMPGLVFAPASGRDLPVVALAHGWLQPVHRYADTLRFLASWGIVAVAPDTQRGPVPAPAELAQDLRTAVDLVASARLAGGRLRVDAARYGVLGHSMGGGAAVLAAASDFDVAAVMTVTASAGQPSAVSAAARVRVPGLHVVGGDDEMAEGDGASIAAAWAGPCQLRTVKGAGHLSLAEGKHWTSTFSGSSPQTKLQRAVRSLAAAFFLRHLRAQDQLDDDLKGKIKRTALEDLAQVRHELDRGKGPSAAVELRKQA
ncbi:dienelactone hydrolase family protein [Nakamurella endophytica]|uniref:dienelactone hydrolase family protein n=1 Tax=Nakamurella endophytica TaxID=1748367 RepID=UPI00166318E0|nr:dienelactone hydrolase family protein [Nakamurella endophytica]